MIEVNDIIKSKLENLPSSPGVYRWKDKNGKVIYVGKAVNLKNRVKSYVRNDKNKSPKVISMIKHAEDLDITITKNELEALILECNLIKELQPKYNISLRDDKTYPYLKVTVNEKWPRIYITRNIKRTDGARYFGPFTDVSSLRKTLKIVGKYYPIRTCRNMNVTRPCLQYHINLCSAPCCNLVSQEKYNEYVKKLCNIFEGKSYEIIKTLKEKMKEASENLQFEKAAMYRDEINAVKSVQQRQNIVSKEGDFDVIGMARTENYAAFEIFYIRYGRMVGKENFNISGTEDERDESIIAAFLKNFYSSDNINIPKEIIISKIPEDFELIKKWLSGIRHNDVSLIVPERGFKRKLKEMAIVNATKYLSDKKIQWEHQKMREQGALIKLKEILKLPKFPERIECFDISHNQGSETTGSMVVFVNGRPEKKAYRKFKLKTTQGKPDDFKSMAEVMERRYNDKKIGRNPDLIVLDGGKGQLNAAIPLIRKSGIEATVIGLAKRMEEIYLENQTEPIVIDRHDEVLHLLQFVRDESHRFVINYHRQWISKRNRESILDHIEGIGPVRRKNLWAAFRTLDDMKKASVEELQKVKGINKKVAENIYNFFRMKKDEKQQILYNSKKD